MITVEYDRETLYQEVWDDPVIVVAQKYGISGNALKKHCITLNVPVPPPGYWTRIRAGAKLKKPKLPKSNGKDKVIVHKHSETVVKSKGKAAKLTMLPDEMRLKIIDFCENIIVPEVLLRPHYLVRDTIQYTKSRKESTRPPVDNLLHISTSEEQFERSLLILDAIFKAIEELGYKIKNNRNDTRICIGKEEVKIRIRETQNRIQHVKSKDELEEEARGKYSFAPSYDFLYTGFLQFVIDDWHAPRKNWNDTKNKKIESEIGDIVITIIETAEALRILREERYQEDLRMRQSELERMKLQELRDSEMKKVQQLEAMANDYKSAMEIYTFLDTLEKGSNNIDDEDERKKIDDYISWGKSKADWLNPIIKKVDPILGTRNTISK